MILEAPDRVRLSDENAKAFLALSLGIYEAIGAFEYLVQSINSISWINYIRKCDYVTKNKTCRPQMGSTKTIKESYSPTSL